MITHNYFGDITPNKQIIDDIMETGGQMYIFDHHSSNIEKVVQYCKEKNFENYTIYTNPKNISNPKSGCLLIYNHYMQTEDSNLGKLCQIISTYDTYTFGDIKSTERINRIMLVVNQTTYDYTVFKELVDNIVSGKLTFDDLEAQGKIIEQTLKSNILRALDSAIVMDVKNGSTIVMCEHYPNFYINQVVRDKFGIQGPLVYINYKYKIPQSLDTKSTWKYSVRSYGCDNVETNAFNIANRFGGGGHQNASGFSSVYSPKEILTKIIEIFYD